MARQQITRAHGRSSTTVTRETDKTIAGPARIRREHGQTRPKRRRRR